MAAIDGAAFLVEPVSAIGPGLDGALTIRVTKDRPGAVRAAAGDWRKTDRTQEAARFRLDSSGDGTTATLEPPERGISRPDNNGPRKPTFVMEKVSRILETMRSEIGVNKLVEIYGESGKARRQTIIEAANLLVDEGFVIETAGPRASRMFRSAQVYRAQSDPESDNYVGGLEEFKTP